MLGLNHIILTGTAAQDFKTEHKNDGLTILEGVVAGDRSVVTPSGIKQLPFYLPVRSVGKGEKSTAQRLTELDIRSGQALLLHASFDYNQWEKDGRKQSKVRLKIIRLEKASEQQTVSDAAGGVRLKHAINQASIAGNLTSDPESGKTDKGDEYVKLRVAVNESWKDAKGEKQEYTHFIGTTLWREVARDFLQQKPKKGSPVLLIGSANNESWTDKEGNKRSDVVIDAHYALVLEGVPARDSEGAEDKKKTGRKRESAPPRASASRAPQADPDDDDESPF